MHNKLIYFFMSESTLTDASFNDDVLSSSIPVLVDFWAPWCGPCQMMGPLIEELSHEYDASKIKITKLNVDDNPSTAGTYQVMSIPTFIIFKNGKVADKMSGGVSKQKMKEFIDKNI